MIVMWPLIILLGMFVFAVGTVVGSFLNVCIYRIPWQKSVIWPGSRCPNCMHEIAGRDNVPIIGWLALRGECRTCGLKISPRYPLIEALVGFLFLGAYVTDVFVAAPPNAIMRNPQVELSMMAYHCVLLSLLVAATFMDYDLMIIPDEITVTGMIVGVGVGTLCPWIRLEPSAAATHWGGLGVGLLGMAAGAGITQFFRLTFSTLLRREAMGFGDVTLLAMIGAFLGWQAAIMTFFLGPFFGIVHALWKLLRYFQKRVTGEKSSSADRELPFGPYLSMAAVTLVLTWPVLWPGWAKGLFESLRVVFWMLLGHYVD
ncbi:MAG: prepilin signal peptidase PulO-like peptidase [Planctomycetes bacterium SCN 63-9]|nr:MAG: prepilin signal peptidase PulO-like peptidase [Planctomycetes bacterium SCN 63-9]